MKHVKAGQQMCSFLVATLEESMHIKCKDEVMFTDWVGFPSVSLFVQSCCPTWKHDETRSYATDKVCRLDLQLHCSPKILLDS